MRRWVRLWTKSMHLEKARRCDIITLILAAFRISTDRHPITSPLLKISKPSLRNAESSGKIAYSSRRSKTSKASNERVAERGARAARKLELKHTYTKASCRSMAIVGKEYCDPEKERVLTVRKTSHFSPGDGFAAYDHRTGGLTFRADTYGRGHGGGAASPGELALLGPAGEPLLTVRRRRPSLHQRWEGFLGARAGGQKPLFSARRSSILGGGAVVELLPSPVPSAVAPPLLLRVNGSFPRRCCRVVAAPRGEGEKEKVVAEIRRKVDVGARVVMGRDVFVLRVSPGFDAAFAMGIVLVLDQIAGDEAGVDAGEDVLDAIAKI